jgi:hypothetical protein
MSAATQAEENAGAIVYEVLGRRALDVDTTIIEYIINVLKDESFDFGVKGEGAYQAVGDLLVDSGCVDDEPEARLVSPHFISLILSYQIHPQFLQIFNEHPLVLFSITRPCAWKC